MYSIGTTYAAVSPDFHQVFVPHMTTEVTKNHGQPTLRDVLGTPSCALAICRHGGSVTLKDAHTAVINLVKQFSESKLHFIVLGTDDFTPPSRQIHYLEKLRPH